MRASPSVTAKFGDAQGAVSEKQRRGRISINGDKSDEARVDALDKSQSLSPPPPLSSDLQQTLISDRNNLDHDETSIHSFARPTDVIRVNEPGEAPVSFARSMRDLPLVEDLAPPQRFRVRDLLPLSLSRRFVGRNFALARPLCATRVLGPQKRRAIFSPDFRDCGVRHGRLGSGQFRNSDARVSCGRRSSETLGTKFVRGGRALKFRDLYSRSP